MQPQGSLKVVEKKTEKMESERCDGGSKVGVMLYLV